MKIDNEITLYDIYVVLYTIHIYNNENETE